MAEALDLVQVAEGVLDGFFEYGLALWKRDPPKVVHVHAHGYNCLHVATPYRN